MLRYDTFLREEVAVPPPPAGISLVGQKVVTASGAAAAFDFTGLTGGSDSSPSDGDYIHMSAHRGSNGNELPWLDVTPAGVNATPIVSIVQGDSVDCGHQVWEGIYESASASGGTLGSSGNRNSAMVITVLRGTIGRNSVAPVTAQGGNGNNPNPPAVTPTVAGSWVLVNGGNGRGVGDQSFDTPGDLNVFRQASNDSGSTYCSTSGTGIKTDWASGAFDPAQWFTSDSSSLDSWCASSIILEPSA